MNCKQWYDNIYIYIIQTTIKGEVQRSCCCRCRCVCCLGSFSHLAPNTPSTKKSKKCKEGEKQKTRSTKGQLLLLLLLLCHVLLLLILLLLLLPLLLQPLLPPLLAAAAASAGCCCKLLGFRLTPNHSSLNQNIYLYICFFGCRSSDMLLHMR